MSDWVDPRDEQVDTLVQAIDFLAPNDRKFATSMLAQLEKTNNLSIKQWFWIGKLADRASNPAKPTPMVNVGEFEGVYALFATAKKHLKFPKIRLQTTTGMPVVLAVAGPRSKQPGVINITDGGRYPDNKWYGRILTDGTWQQGKSEVPQEIVSLVKALALDPVTTASEFGRLTGNCCFCAKGLTDERSTQVGYGPICAGHYGLPWGNKQGWNTK